ncbi:MAG: hypothetical protein IIX89_01765 [Oscillospiraceae bacterium]|nr:hypothetical protein [Oscillospiraceae bacterium]MBQ5816667.1 hypothetical protein [Oscillospiraceae bacterium]
MKNKKPTFFVLLPSLFEAIIGILAFVSFFVLTANGISVGKWAIALIAAFVLFMLGLFGIIGWVKKRREPEIDEDWFSPINMD